MVDFFKIITAHIYHYKNNHIQKTRHCQQGVESRSVRLTDFPSGHQERLN